jgi:four helix bundle protein
MIHKLRIARKECKETIYWLELVRDKIEVSLSIQPFISKYQQLSYLIWRITVNSK